MFQPWLDLIPAATVKTTAAITPITTPPLADRTTETTDPLSGLGPIRIPPLVAHTTVATTAMTTATLST